MERNIDQLLVGVRGQRLGNHRGVKAVQGQRAAHLFNRGAELGLRKARAGIELAGTLKLRIHVCAFGSIHVDSPDECPRGSAEDQDHSALDPRSLHFNGFKEAGGIELAQASLQFFSA